MKFRDPETGKVFDDIEAAMNYFCFDCGRLCNICPFHHENCGMTWVKKHPEETALKMGYDVVEEKEDSIGKTDKPRLAEVLGVEVGERFTICKGSGVTCKLSVNEAGNLLNIETGVANNVDWLVYAINHPESIVRVPRLTDPEIAIMREVGAKWVSRDDDPDNDDYVDLWSEKPEKFEDTYGCKRIDALSSIKAEFFPSVNPGDCVEATEGE